ncbi:MAG: SGNH/GDSL hydrolase family protein [Trichormus sp. ATA11-4-KO1]|jgi:phospholipase/lecithinase/hemolysin|nr:SGNH/GDSL hydrolase family protein [Trichormus sp. ATA11-4-KO1]
MYKQILMTGFLLLSVMFSSKATATDFDEIYVFGDSYSDSGSYYNYTKNVLGTGFPPQPYYEGRLTNGPVWVEYLAQKLGLRPNPNTNFAAVGAESGLFNIVASPSLPSLYLTGVLSQVNNFTSANKSVNPNALYIVSGGFNDIFFSSETVDPNQPVTNILTAVRSLAAAGASNILVVNLPNLGDLPGTNDSQASKKLNDLTAKYNTSLAANLDSLNQQLNTINIAFLDINSLFKQVFANPRRYGFTDVISSCLGSSVLTALPPSSISAVCNTNSNQAFFWDSIHPTTAGHEVIAESASQLLCFDDRRKRGTAVLHHPQQDLIKQVSRPKIKFFNLIRSSSNSVVDQGARCQRPRGAITRPRRMKKTY